MFVHQMTKWFGSLTKEEIRQKQMELDLKSIEKYGLRLDRFLESFVGTYQYFCHLTGKKQKDFEIES